jgi:Anti-sigma-K factor rskA/Putative zinc-finger
VRLLRHDLHTLTGAYALDAVDGAERDRFEHHLRRCRPCGNEVRGLAETATTLAMAVAMPPPGRLKQRVMNAVGVTRQVPPAVDHRRRARLRFGSLPHGAARSSSWVPRLATAVAAVSLAVAVTFGILQISTQHQLDSARAQNQAIAAVIAAPDARIVTQATAAGGTGSVVVSRAEAKIVFTSAGLPALPATEVYELWLIGPPRIRPAGLLPSPSAGKTAPVLASGLAAGDKVGLTVEPAGGTRMPTTTPILLMTLPA